MQTELRSTPRKAFKIALLSGGNAGEKLCRTLNIPASSSTLFRLIHEQELKEPLPSEALGIDDWAFKKGINYSTAIVDLKRHKIIDFLLTEKHHRYNNG
ncbi:MAG: hypothetical protein ABIQ00_13900 [Chitinophagaceae bacterium]